MSPRFCSVANSPSSAPVRRDVPVISGVLMRIRSIDVHLTIGLGERGAARTPVVEHERAFVDLGEEAGRRRRVHEDAGDDERGRDRDDPSRMAQRAAERALVSVGERVDARGRSARGRRAVSPRRASASVSRPTREDTRSLSSGMIVSATTSDTSTAMVSVIDSAWKNCPSTPVSRPSGRKTTTVVIVDVVTGQISSCTASRIARSRSCVQVDVANDVLGDHHGVVDHECRSRSPSRRASSG